MFFEISSHRNAHILIQQITLSSTFQHQIVSLSEAHCWLVPSSSILLYDTKKIKNEKMQIKSEKTCVRNPGYQKVRSVPNFTKLFPD